MGSDVCKQPGPRSGSLFAAFLCGSGLWRCLIVSAAVLLAAHLSGRFPITTSSPKVSSERVDSSGSSALLGGGSTEFVRGGRSTEWSATIDPTVAAGVGTPILRENLTKGSLVQAMDKTKYGEIGWVKGAASTSGSRFRIDFGVGTRGSAGGGHELGVEQLLLLRQGGERAGMPQWFPAPQQQRQAGKLPDAAVKRVVAFGDSLTAGFCNGGRNFEPYGRTLAAKLLPEIIADVWVNGMSGGLAIQMVAQADWNRTTDVTRRTGVGLTQLLKSKSPVDLLLIMVGTNDLAHGKTPSRIAGAAQQLHELSHALGVPTAMLSIPPNRAVAERPRYAQRWAATNSLMHAWAEQKMAEIGETIGQARLLAYFNTSVLQEEMFDRDGLHWSAIGSQRLGELLSPVVREILQKG